MRKQEEIIQKAMAVLEPDHLYHCPSRLSTIQDADQILSYLKDALWAAILTQKTSAGEDLCPDECHPANSGVNCPAEKKVKTVCI